MWSRTAWTWMAKLTAISAFAITACLAGPASASCPIGTQFFAYGGSGGCVKPGTNEVAVKCFRMPSCPSGWSREHKDDKGVWCCPPPRAETRQEWLDRVHPNRSCAWRGTAPICDGKCQSGEFGVVRSKDGHELPRYASGFGARCATGGKIYCCRDTFRRR